PLVQRVQARVVGRPPARPEPEAHRAERHRGQPLPVGVGVDPAGEGPGQADVLGECLESRPSPGLPRHTAPHGVAMTASAGMPGFRRPSGLSIPILTRKTRLTRSLWVWTFRGVNSASEAISVIRPAKACPGNASTVTRAVWPIRTRPSSTSGMYARSHRSIGSTRVRTGVPGVAVAPGSRFLRRT